MEFKKVKDFNKNGMNGSIYDTNQSLDIDTIIKVIKHYEDEKTKLYECKCDTFSESGRPYSPIIYNTESLKRLYEFDNPSISISAMYINPKDQSYKFTISMANNTRGMNYYYSENDANYVKRHIELDNMRKEEEEKKTNQEIITEDKSYQK